MDESASGSGIEVRLVDSGPDRDAFINVPFDIYNSADHWVPPLKFERREHFSTTKNPYYDHAEVALWLALRDGKPVGRVSTQICELHLERYNDETGHFGFLECIDDDAVFDALLETANDWFAKHGVTRIVGPLSFSINDESGLLIDGFDSPPSMLMNYAKPYYKTQLERNGFTKVRDLFAYEYTNDLQLPASVLKMVQRATASGELEIRPFDMSNFERDLEIVIDIFNDAWSDNWGFVPMTYREVKALGNNLKLLLKGDYGAIGYYQGKPAAMAITLPNVNEAIDDLNGNMLPIGWLKLLWRLKLKTPNSIRLPLMGVRKHLQSGVIGSALAVGVIDKVRDYHRSRGVTRGELSWILEDNVPVRRLIELMGAHQSKTYRIFERPVQAPGPR